MAPRNGLPERGTAGGPALAPEALLEAASPAARIVLRPLAPLVDAGRLPARGTVGQAIAIEAEIFMDGHERIAACAVVERDGADSFALPLRAAGNDRWTATLVPRQAGRYRLRQHSWRHAWGSFREVVEKKHAARQPLSVEIMLGRQLVREALRRGAELAGADLAGLEALQRELAVEDEALLAGILLSDTAAALMQRADPRQFLVRAEPLPLEVERAATAFGAWYELFPRSLGSGGRHGTFDDVIGRLPAIRAMGFDVLYLPPIHPIGRSHRKGRNNSLSAGPDDPGSPYAIGAEEGGHDAVHPQLGGIEGFRRLRAAAHDLGLELALDFAIQCSPDHPWLRQHPEWFTRLPDGSIRYAENPPKKYEDIVNVDFYAPAALPDLWLALRDVVAYWVGEGVKLFRVDNPHTKPLPFWQWLIADIRAAHPEVLFLSEAFTRPAMMQRLAQIGFSQSYTYFTWRNSKSELAEYLTELTQGPARHYFRPHFFVNTPDINPYFLQTSGRPGFLIRAALAATLSGLWGLYSGFELCEGAALPGKEEYLDSEKYQLRPRDWSAPGNIVAEISRLNHIRRDNPALHSHLGLRFYQADNEQVLYYGKATPDLDNFILVAVSLDPHHAQEARFEVPLWEFGLADDATIEAEELMRNLPLRWRGKWQHWRFEPSLPFAVWRLRGAQP